MDYYARKTKDGRKQILIEHLNKVVELSSKWAEPFGLSGLAGARAYITITVKRQTNSQIYLFLEESRKEMYPQPMRAKAAYKDYISCLPVAEVLANIIASHHGSLRDYLSPTGALLVSELKSSTKPEAENNQKISPEILYKELQDVINILPDKALRYDDAYQDVVFVCCRCRQTGRILI